MFDKLVESTKSKTSYRGGRIFILTGLLYATLLTTLGVWTILGLNPGLAESFDLTKLAPPIPLGPSVPAQPKLITATLKPAPSEIFTPPTQVPPIADASLFERIRPVERGTLVAGGIACADCRGVPDGLPGINSSEEPPPPPPVVKPKPTPDPTPEVKPTPSQPLKVSEGVAQGLAIRKVAPAYPAMGKAVRASGPVQIQVTISEEGQVIEAAVLNGHPLLRQAALEAARQWVFRPTLLSKVPVKVQGVLTFNFMLN